MQLETFCGYPFNRVRVTAEGWVAFCCYMRPNGNQPMTSAYIGNVLQDSFDDIWFGKLAESVREETAAGQLHNICRKPGCPYSSQNPPYVKHEVIYNEYPTFLEIDLPNTHCNVGGLKPDPVKSPACIMCERSDPNFRPEEDHLFQVLDRIKNIVPNLSQIHVQGIAEPFFESSEFGYLAFDVLDALDFDKFAHKIIVSVTTNGTLFKQSVRHKYLSKVPNSVTTFSIDAATPETFKRIRIFDCFDKVVENICAFCREREPHRQHTRIHNNINTLNVHEVVGMVQLAHQAGVECVEFNPTDGFHRSILVNEDNCGLFRKAHNDIVAECERLGQNHNFIRPLDLGLVNRLVQLTL